MADILQACAHLPLVTFAPGEVLLTEGDPPGALFVLTEGRVEVSKSGVPIVQLSGAGVLFGEMSVLLGRPISASVTALDTVRARRCDEPDRLIDESPEIARHAARSLAARLHAATTYIADLKVQFAEETGHLGIMDRMLDAMLEGAPVGTSAGIGTPNRARDDPRL